MAFIDDGKYEWKEVYIEIKEYIESVTFKRGEQFNEIYNEIKLIKDFSYDIIHNKLYKYKDIGDNEKNIRTICKYIISKILPYITRVINLLDMKLRKKDDMDLALLLKSYYELEDDLYAIASFRSLVHFAHYMERQDDRSQLVWKYNMDDTMGGIFYYSNAMILDHKYKNLIKQCPTGYGKCVDENTYVDTNCGRIKIKDVKIGDMIYSMDKNKLVQQIVTNKWKTNKEQVIITTQSGKKIILSPEHRMFTQKGYKQAKDITTNDYLYSQLCTIDGDYEIDKDELLFVSSMIFEGSCTQNIFSFTQEDNEFKNCFLNCCDNLGITYKQSQKKGNKAISYWFHTKDKKVENLLKKYNIYNCNSHTKRLDRRFFELPLKQKYDFISYMIATDGYIPKYNGYSLIGISLANELLIDDIQYLLSTCGIYSKKSYKKVKLNEKEFDSWNLTIPDEYVEILYKNCYFYHKQYRIEERYNIIKSKKVNVYCNRTNYPKEVIEHCKEFKKENNKQWARNKTFKKEKVEEFNNRTHLLDNIIYKDFYYDKIISIEYKKEKIPMIDIEVAETHNFIANGFVSHNSKSDCVIISFCFGYDVNDDIMKIVGNKDLVKPITESIVKMLKSEKFGKVFPEFGKYKGSGEMFKNCALTDGTFTLRDSKKALSFACRNKETAIDGGRYNKQFYDDVTQSNDAENIPQHLKDRAKYDAQWKKRQYDEFSCLRWFTGTAYHREDFLSYIKKHYSYNRELQLELSTKTKKWNRYVRINCKQDTIYISVPKLADLELGEDKCFCTFPQKYSKEEALSEFHGDISKKRRFMAMEQQQPMPPESMAFDWIYLKQYDELPSFIKEKLCTTIVIIDPNRRGRDNYAGLIFKKCWDDSDPYYYLVDCFYKKVSSKIALPKICERASYHFADIIAFETNTVDSYQMKKEINEWLSQHNWRESKVVDFYSTINKEEKIHKYSDDIKDYIVFPRRGMYYEDSDMGRAMQDIVNYSFEGKNLNDDSIDCCAMLMHYVSNKTKNTIQSIKISL